MRRCAVSSQHTCRSLTRGMDTTTARALQCAPFGYTCIKWKYKLRGGTISPWPPQIVTLAYYSGGGNCCRRARGWNEGSVSDSHGCNPAPIAPTPPPHLPYAHRLDGVKHRLLGETASPWPLLGGVGTAVRRGEVSEERGWAGRQCGARQVRTGEEKAVRVVTARPITHADWTM